MTYTKGRHAAHSAEIRDFEREAEKHDRLRAGAPRIFGLIDEAWDKLNKTVDEAQRRSIENLINSLGYYAENGAEASEESAAFFREEFLR